MEKRPLRAGTWLHLGSERLLQCFEKCSASSVPGESQQMHQRPVHVSLGNACCPGTHSASVAGWAEMSFPSNIKVWKKRKGEGCSTQEQCLSTLHWEIGFYP